MKYVNGILLTEDFSVLLNVIELAKLNYNLPQFFYNYFTIFFQYCNNLPFAPNKGSAVGNGTFIML